MNKNFIILGASAAIIAAVVGVSVYSQQHKRALTDPSPNATLYSSPSAGTHPTPSASRIPTTNPSDACSSADIAATIDSSGGGTAGTTYRKVVLTNHSGHTCTLQGFPGVSLVDSAGAQLGAPAARDGVAGAAITLKANASATSAVGFPDAANFQAGACSANSASLKVYPPGQTNWLLVPLAAQNCPGFSVQALTSG